MLAGRVKSSSSQLVFDDSGSRGRSSASTFSSSFVESHSLDSSSALPLLSSSSSLLLVAVLLGALSLRIYSTFSILGIISDSDVCESSYRSRVASFILFFNSMYAGYFCESILVRAVFFDPVGAVFFDFFLSIRLARNSIYSFCLFNVSVGIAILAYFIFLAIAFIRLKKILFNHSRGFFSSKFFSFCVRSHRITHLVFF